MNTQDKLDTLKPTALQNFEAGHTLDEVCALSVKEAVEAGIGFTEIQPLVKTIGKDAGFIVELADRKHNAGISIEGGLIPDNLSYDSMVEWSQEIAKVYDVPELFALGNIKERMKRESYIIPTKPQLSGWKLCALTFFQVTNEPTRKEVQDALLKRGFNHHKYTQAYHELFTALVAL